MEHAFTRVGNRRYDLIGHLRSDPLGAEGDWIFVQRSGDRLPDSCDGQRLEFRFSMLDAVGTVRLDQRSRMVKAEGSLRVAA